MNSINYIQKEFIADKSFNKNMVDIAFKVLKENSPIYEDTKKNKKVVLLNDTENNRTFLFYKLNNQFHIYFENKQPWSKFPFEHTLASLKKDTDEIYASGFILSGTFPSNKKFGKKEKHDTLKGLKPADKNMDLVQKIMKKLADLVNLGGLIKITYQAQNIKILTDYLFKNNYLENAIEEKRFLNIGYDNAHNFNAEAKDLIIKLNYLNKITTEHKYNSKRKFEFNDLDNHVWKTKDYLYITDQNMGFVALTTDSDSQKKNWIIYQYSKDSEVNLKLEKELLQAIKDNKINQLLDIALKIENEKIIYFDNGSISNFFSDIHYSVEAVERETQTQVEYSIDIKDYDYQLAYHQEVYGLSEVEFLAQALLTMGGGFDYDVKTGRFFSSSVNFLESCINRKKDMEPAKCDQLSYCYTEKLKTVSYLDEKWKAGLTMLVETLERDKPKVIAGSKNAIKEAIQAGKEVMESLAKKAKKKL